MSKDELAKILNVNPDDIIDDSKMPTPEEVAKFPDTSEIDNEFHKEADAIFEKYGL